MFPSPWKGLLDSTDKHQILPISVGEFKVQDKWNPMTVTSPAYGKTRVESSEVGQKSARFLCDLAHILSRTQFSNINE